MELRIYPGGVLGDEEEMVRKVQRRSLNGVALGMALLAVQRFPEFEPYLSLVIAATVVFELFGPVASRRSLVRMGALRPS